MRKILEPVTDNKERARAAMKAPSRGGSPSRAHKNDPTRGHHSKKAMGGAPKVGGRPR